MYPRGYGKSRKKIDIDMFVGSHGAEWNAPRGQSVKFLKVLLTVNVQIATDPGAVAPRP